MAILFTFSVAAITGSPFRLAAKVGNQLPIIETAFQNVDGKKLKVQDLMGKKGLLVIFGCNSCPYVKAWLNRIVRLGNLALDKKIGVAFINSNDPSYYEQDSFPNMKNLHQRLKMNFPYLSDPKSLAARAFGATRTPEVYLYNSKSQLVYHGAIDDYADNEKKVTKPYLQKALTRLSKNKSISPKSTRFIGCGIKFSKDKQGSSK